MGFLKFSKYQGLHLTNYKNLVEDTSINSPDYFRITQFPEKLTCGKNAFLIAGNHLAFEPMSQIKFECVAQDGSNIYMEVPSWVDGSNNRMIVLYVYPWTVQGNAMITLVGKLRKTGATVRWKRLIQVDPFAPNVTPLVFGRKPKAFVQEKRKEYLNQTWPIGNTAEQTYSTGQISLVNQINGGISQTIATLSGGAEFTSDMVGGHLIIADPNHTLVNSIYGVWVIPDAPQVYDGYITEILTNTTALVNHPYEILNPVFQWDSSYIPDLTYPTYLAEVNASDYTLDYIQTPIYTTGSGNVESYALVTISNLEPISGDADKVVTYMRSAGFTEWEKIGDDNLNHKELLIDGGSHELTRKMGYFVDDYTKDTYWSSSAHGYNNSGDYPNLSIQSSSLMDALRISGSEQFTDTSDRPNSYIRVNNTIPVDFYADNEYQISFKFHRQDDLFDGFPAELIVYMSGSAFDNVDQNGLKTDATLGKQITTLGEENTFSTWQAQVAAIQSQPNFMAGTIYVGSYESNAMFEAVSIADNPGGNAAGPVFQGSSVSMADAQESSKNFWTAAGANIVPDPETQTYTFKADKDGQGVPVFQIKAGIWDISKISVKAIALPGFTPNHTFLLSHIPSEKMEDLLDFKWEFYDGQNNKSSTFLVTHSMNFSGSNTFIEDALLPGTFNIGQSYAGTGFQFSGKSSAMIRTMGPDYPGFSQATGSGGGGIIIWSGSIGADGKEYAGQPYYGVGMELVGSSSWLRFRTQTGSDSGAGGELDITTNKFFLGSRTSFLSGSGDGTIAISSSNFELGTDGAVVMQGTITAEAGGTIGGWDITANTIEDLNPSGKGIKLTSDASTPKIEIIKDASTDYIKLYHTTDSDWGIIGRENNTNVFLLGDPGGSGNKIAGWSFNDKRLSSWTTATADKFGISLDADYQLITIHGDSGEGKNNVGDNDRDNVRVAIGQLDTNEFGIRGWSTGDGSSNSGKRIFELSSIRNEIAGWTIGSKHISSSNLLLSASGVIQTADFQSSEFGTGKGWKIGSDGIAEFEEAKIRGTLKTAVFEKDTVSAVGGQLIISNATAIKSGSMILSNLVSLNDIASFTSQNDCTIDSATQVTFTDDTGLDRLKPIISDQYELVAGRVYRAKATISGYGGSSTIGFSQDGGVDVTNGRRSSNGEIETTFTYTGGGAQVHVFSNVGNVGVISNITIEEMTYDVDNASGFIAGEYVLAKATSSNGFIEEIVKIDSVDTTNNTLVVSRSANGNLIPSMSSGQTLVSLGSKGTGYIHMNASPSSADTPYIDIVERTGSAVNDTDIVARIGDLSGINDDHFADGVTGHGIYTTNGYFKGKLDVSAVPTAPFVSDSEIIHYNFAAGTGTTVINQAAPSDNWTLYSGSIQGTAVWGSGSDAITGTALKMDEGNNTYIRVYDTNAWNSGGAVNIVSQSFSTWFKVANVAHTEPQIIWEAGGDTAGNGAYVSRSLLYYTSFDDAGNGSNEAVVVSSSISSGKWYHAAGVFANGTSSLWLDGRRVDYKENYRYDSSRITYTNKMGVGGVHQDFRLVDGNGGGTFSTLDSDQGLFTGSIDEIRIYYGKALTELEIKGLYGTPAGAAIPTSTIIEGGRIKTGQIQSKNYSTAAGGEIDLDEGTITFGGTATSSFAVSSAGLVTATNFSERFTVVTSTNKAQYFEDYDISGGSTNDATRIICDGSLGGDVTLNIQLDVAPDYKIADIKLPSQGSGITTRVRLIINADSITMDDGEIYQNSSNALAQR